MAYRCILRWFVAVFLSAIVGGNALAASDLVEKVAELADENSPPGCSSCHQNHGAWKAPDPSEQRHMMAVCR